MSPDKTQFADKLADGNLRPPPISKPDAQFVEDMGLEFVYTREGIVLTELNDLFEKVRRGAVGTRWRSRGEQGRRGTATAAQQQAAFASALARRQPVRYLLSRCTPLACALAAAAATTAPPAPASAQLTSSAPAPALPQVGFPRRDIDKLRVALENTYHLIWIRSTKQVGRGDPVLVHCAAGACAWPTTHRGR